jgi:hypothetical protein
MAKQRRYLSYLLRLWQTSDGEKQVWRASLESPGAGERQGFASLEALFGFLQAQTEPRSEENCGYDTRGREGGGAADNVMKRET